MFFGLSVKGAVTPDMVKVMADKPIIFAMANPDPEITPEEVAEVRTDAIMATGRSDYPNQINNVLGFPYIFRGALDVQARAINMEMKIAAAHALAQWARRRARRAAAYGVRPKYGSDYIIPVPFDLRPTSYSAGGGASGEVESRAGRSSTWEPTGSNCARAAIRSPACCSAYSSACAGSPRRVVFAEGEEESR